MPLFPDPKAYSGYQKNADLSDCGRYRWSLTRSWAHGGDGRTICFIGLNPSTADAMQDDPTVRRCVGFVKRWGASRLVMLNLFAWRATEPKELLKVELPVGPRNGILLDGTNKRRRVDLMVAAWGSWVPFDRDKEVLKLLDDVPLFCLGRTKSGMPRHPLYVKADAPLIPFNAAAERYGRERMKEVSHG